MSKQPKTCGSPMAHPPHDYKIGLEDAHCAGELEDHEPFDTVAAPEPTDAEQIQG